MTTLKANRAQRVSLEAKRLAARLASVRGKAETYPQLSLSGLVDGAENKLRLLHLDAAADLLDTVEKRIARHLESLEEAEMAAAGQAQDQLLAERGVETQRETGPATRHGFLWLCRKRRLVGSREQAGLRWSADYGLTRTDGVRSCLNDNVVGGGSDPNSEDRAAKALADARQRLAAGRAHIIAATGSAHLADLLDAVCGRGETLREIARSNRSISVRRATMAEAELMIALDMVEALHRISRRQAA